MGKLRPAEWSRYGVTGRAGAQEQSAWKALNVAVLGEGGLAAELALQLVRVGVGGLALWLTGRIAEMDLGATSLFRASDFGQPLEEAAWLRLLEHQPHCNVVRGEAWPDASFDFVFRVLTDSEGPGAGPAFSHLVWEGASGAYAFRVGDSGCPWCSPVAHWELPCGETIVGGLRALVLPQLTARVIEDLSRPGGESRLLGVGLQGKGLSCTWEALRGAGCSRCTAGAGDPQPNLQRSGEAANGRSQKPQAGHVVGEVDPVDVADLVAAGVRLIDVREAREAAIVAIPGSELVSLRALTDRCRDWDRERPLLLYCKTGARSARGLQRLGDLGFERIGHVRGGILAWIDRVSPGSARY